MEKKIPEFGPRLARLMKQKEMNGNQLAVASGISRQAISAFLNGQNKKPALWVAIKLARALGVSIAEFE